MFPETCGRSLEEIEEVFSQGHVFTAWKIKRDVGRKTLQDVKEANGMHHIVRAHLFATYHANGQPGACRTRSQEFPRAAGKSVNEIGVRGRNRYLYKLIQSCMKSSVILKSAKSARVREASMTLLSVEADQASRRVASAQMEYNTPYIADRA